VPIKGENCQRPDNGAIEKSSEVSESILFGHSSEVSESILVGHSSARRTNISSTWHSQYHHLMFYLRVFGKPGAYGILSITI
jgi:hypothetical protein